MTRKRRKPKFLILTNHSYMLWQFRRELIRELMQTYTVYLAMPFVGHEEDFKEMGARCIRVSFERRSKDPFKDIRLFRTYLALLDKIHPDKVMTYSIKPNIYGGLACRIRKIPYFSNVQGLGTAFQTRPLADLVTIMYKEGLRGARKVFFENEANAAEFDNRGIVSADRQVLLTGAGVNLEHFSYQPYPENETFHFLYLGRIMREKGMDELFAAVEQLQGDFVLDLVGFYEDEYEEKVRNLEERGIVRFHGFQEDPRPYYAAADCIVMPSYHEGMSNVNLEAAATGRPVITTDIPGCREAVDDGKTGKLVIAKDTYALYTALKFFLSLSRQECMRMGLDGRKKMEREFDRKQVIRTTIRTINNERYLERR